MKMKRKYALQLLERAHMVHCNPSRTPVDIESKLGPDGVPVQDPTLYRSGGYSILHLHVHIWLMPFSRFAFICMIRGNLTLMLSSISCDMFEGLWILVSSYMLPLLLLWLVILMLIGQVAPLHEGLLQVIVFFWVIIFYLGQLNASTPSLAPVPKLNTMVLLMLSQRLHDFAIYFMSYILLYRLPLLFTVIMLVRVLHVPSRFQYADIFTKGLPSVLFEDFRSSLSVRPPSALTAEAY
ncbi:ribonuclease H-like domain-containing protein [Tanacetum coccineum]